MGFLSRNTFLLVWFKCNLLKKNAMKMTILFFNHRLIVNSIAMKPLLRLTILIPCMMLAAGCTKDFEEINTNSAGFTQVSDGALFNSVIASLVPSGNEQFYINNDILYKQTQLAVLTIDAWGNYAIGTEDIWKNYYNTLPAIRELEKRFSNYPASPAVNNMAAMLKIVLAYKTFKMTDLFGDIPFSQAGYGFQNVALLHPEYDTQRDIYLSQLTALGEAATAIDDTAAVAEPFTTFGQFDKLFMGDVKMWRKFANSLSLRYALRMSEKEPEVAGEIIRDIIENNKPVLTGYNLASSVLEAACIYPSLSGFKYESLNWSFREHKWLRMGSNIWHQLSTNDNPDGSGIFDPRAYIFFETNGDNQWVPFPQIPEATTPSPGGIPYETHRAVEGNFGIKGSNCNYSFFNYFIVRDEDFMPIILMTGAEVHFIKSEAYFRGIGVGMDQNLADNEYLSGISASVDWWQKTAENSRLPLSGARFNDLITVPEYLDAASVQNAFGWWNAETDEQKLKFLYTQRWLDAFRQPAEAYSLARRVSLLPREGNPLNHFRLPYPNSENQFNTTAWSNARARQGGDSPEVKVWWMP